MEITTFLKNKKRKVGKFRKSILLIAAMVLLQAFGQQAFGQQEPEDQSIAAVVMEERELTPQEAVDRFARLSCVDSTKVAVMVTDLKTGRVLGEWNASTPLIPASIQKAVTTATLLRSAGKDWKYETKVYFEGRKQHQVLDGNLLIVASGDPTINSAKLPLTPDFVADIVAAVKKAGIDSIAGRISIDESVFGGPCIPETWASGDRPHSYGTGVHGFNFQNNSSGKASVSNPAGIFRDKLEKALTREGIAIGRAEIEPGGKRSLISVHRSAPLDEIMRSCMMRSDNLYAEAMLQTLPLSHHEESTLSRAIELEKSYWRKKKADMRGVVIADGSGLSRSNRTTAKFMTDVLDEMSGDAYYASFFPLAGKEGTLRSLLSGTRLEEYVAMKTGSMSGIQCYAGYLLDDDYAPTHSIVVIVNGMKGSRANVRRGVEQMLLSIFK